MCDADGAVSIRVVKQKNDQLVVGHLAYLVSTPAWGAACLVKLFSAWVWFRGWLRERQDREGRVSRWRANRGTGADLNALFAWLARSQVGFGLLSAGISAATR